MAQPIFLCTELFCYFDEGTTEFGKFSFGELLEVCNTHSRTWKIETNVVYASNVECSIYLLNLFSLASILFLLVVEARTFILMIFANSRTAFGTKTYT